MKLLKLFICNLIEYKELLINLSIKDLKVRYKSAILGFLWAVIVPIATAMVFLIIFKSIFNVRELTTTFLLAALFPWTFVNFSITNSTTSYVDNAQILKKTYFPREFIPLSIITSNSVNFILSEVILIIIALFQGYDLTLKYFLLPIVIFFNILVAIGISFLVSSLFVFFRDIKYIVEIGMMIWFYLTPVFYDQRLIKQFSPYAFKIFLLNPLTGLIIIYRDIILYNTISSFELISFTFSLCFIIFILGYYTLKKLDKNIVDYV